MLGAWWLVLGAWWLVVGAMRYSYAYKTKDGTRHEATMVAESREEVFVRLREQGVKAIKVVAADGSKANGEIRGVRKRVVIAAVLATAVLAGGAVFLAFNRLAGESDETYRENVAVPLPRQEILGDRKRIEVLPSEVGQSPVDAFLAKFAEPGRPFSAPQDTWPSREAFEEAFHNPLKVSEKDFTEQIDLKRMIEGMKREMKKYLRCGGLVSGYIRELIKRQNTEIAYREKAEKKLFELLAQKGGRQAAYDYWVKANAQLQSMGIYALPLPNRLSQMQSAIDLDE